MNLVRAVSGHFLFWRDMDGNKKNNAYMFNKAVDQMKLSLLLLRCPS